MSACGELNDDGAPGADRRRPRRPPPRGAWRCSPVARPGRRSSAVRPAPLPPVTGVLAGSTHAPLVPAAGLVLLAAAVALLAVRAGRADRRRRAHGGQRRRARLDGRPRPGRGAAGRRGGGAGRRRDAGRRGLRRSGPPPPSSPASSGACAGLLAVAPGPALAGDGTPLRADGAPDGGRRGAAGPRPTRSAPSWPGGPSTAARTPPIRRRGGRPLAEPLRTAAPAPRPERARALSRVGPPIGW